MKRAKDIDLEVMTRKRTENNRNHERRAKIKLHELSTPYVPLACWLYALYHLFQNLFSL